MKLVTRAEWGARAPRSRPVRTLTGPTRGHWNGPTVTHRGLTSWDHAGCASLVRGIQNFHMDGNGWDDIAYNFVECPHGYTFEGRGLNIRSAANGTNVANNSGHAIMCLAGENNRFSTEEKIGFRQAVRYISDKTDAPDAAIGHRDDKATACPGNERYDWIRHGMPVPSIPTGGKKMSFLVRTDKDPAVWFVTGDLLEKRHVLDEPQLSGFKALLKMSGASDTLHIIGADSNAAKVLALIPARGATPPGYTGPTL